MFEEIKTSKSLMKSEEIDKFNSFINKYYEKRNSYLVEIFYGFQEDIYECISCQYSNFNFQGINILNLPIMTLGDKPITSLEKSIKYYQSKQILSTNQNFPCPNPECKSKMISSQSIIISLPKILIINFKRVGENNFYNHNVDIPEILKMNDLIKNENYKDYEYELIGFIKHIGTASLGHNIAICKNFFDNTWYTYNDSMVSINNSCKNENEKIPNTSNGFLFFYKNKDCQISEYNKKLIIEASRQLRK